MKVLTKKMPKFMQTLKYIKDNHMNTYKYNKHNSSCYKLIYKQNYEFKMNKYLYA